MLMKDDEGGGVKQMLTIADEEVRGDLKTPKFGWRDMWTAPKQTW